jgi:hypothetical protein
MSGTEVRFNDDSPLTPGAVIWATGFALDNSFTRGSALLGWIKDDAAHLATQIAKFPGHDPVASGPSRRAVAGMRAPTPAMAARTTAAGACRDGS